MTTPHPSIFGRIKPRPPVTSAPSGNGNGSAKAKIRRPGGPSPWKCGFVQFDYLAQLELARVSKNALLAVMAELYRIHYENRGVKKPFPFGMTKALRELKITRPRKIKALEALAAAGWIYVEWADGKAPLVTILKGFHHNPR
jgi:hypothetical protein